jgi:uncharacterized membrane protein
MEDILIYMVENLFFMPFLIGVVFVITGFIMLKFPPKTINHLYGYKTKKSMINQDVWNFSQRYSSLKMVQSGLFMVVFSFLGNLVQPDEKLQIIVGITLSILVCIFLFYSTENAIKKNFPNL